MHLEGELDQMTTAIKTLRTQLMQKKDYFEDSLKSLETLYKTTMEEIDNLRKAINDSLDKLQKKTIKELEASLTRLRTSIQTDIEHCNTSIKQLIEKHDWLDRKDTNEALQFIKYRTCLEELNQTKEELQQMTTKDVTTLAFCPDETIQIFVNILSGLGYIPSQVNSAPGQKGHDVYKTTMIYNKNDPESSGTSKPGRLGEEVSGIHSKAGTNPVMKVKETKHNATQSNIASATRKTISSDLHKTSSMNISSQKCDPNQLITVNSSKMTTVRMKKDSETCYISGICETATGELLVTDWNNSRIKILDKSLKVTDHCDLPGKPWSTCIIDSSLLAVALNSWEVHFIRLKKTLLGLSSLKLQHDETFKLPHSIMGIYHHQGNLYVTSGTALYHYKIDGRRLMTCDVKKMYEDTKGGMTGNYYRCLYLSEPILRCQLCL
ncbi:hypothetical protein DPMN_117426 [Dreissena polymorpha]|uniref:Uncharacterized protein n=1 Tax=Dreissena polymorpha TaxID=45954 RepID=A0A9D4KPY8_DREPO|nr:hypothetical protein DPMN_117426 [Dreissena polymorpha]